LALVDQWFHWSKHATDALWTEHLRVLADQVPDASPSTAAASGHVGSVGSLPLPARDADVSASGSREISRAGPTFEAGTGVRLKAGALPRDFYWRQYDSFNDLEFLSSFMGRRCGSFAAATYPLVSTSLPSALASVASKHQIDENPAPRPSLTDNNGMTNDSKHFATREQTQTGDGSGEVCGPRRVTSTLDFEIAAEDDQKEVSAVLATMVSAIDFDMNDEGNVIGHANGPGGIHQAGFGRGLLVPRVSIPYHIDKKVLLTRHPCSFPAPDCHEKNPSVELHRTEAEATVDGVSNRGAMLQAVEEYNDSVPIAKAAAEPRHRTVDRGIDIDMDMDRELNVQQRFPSVPSSSNPVASTHLTASCRVGASEGKTHGLPRKSKQKSVSSAAVPDVDLDFSENVDSASAKAMSAATRPLSELQGKTCAIGLDVIAGVTSGGTALAERDSASPLQGLAMDGNSGGKYEAFVRDARRAVRQGVDPIFASLLQWSAELEVRSLDSTSENQLGNDIKRFSRAMVRGNYKKMFVCAHRVH
jgi:hypothetical protein